MAKAERAYNTSSNPDAFLKSLFDHLPADVEPVMTRSFRVQSARAAHDAWRNAMCCFESMQHMLMLCRVGQIGKAWFLDDAFAVAGVREVFWRRTTEDELLRLCDKARDLLIKTPAPNLAALRVKRTRAMEFPGRYGSRPDWEAAIAEDEARLAGRSKLSPKVP